MKFAFRPFFQSFLFLGTSEMVIICYWGKTDIKKMEGKVKPKTADFILLFLFHPSQLLKT
jgi:hypothetical protein